LRNAPWFQELASLLTVVFVVLAAGVCPAWGQQALPEVSFPVLVSTEEGNVQGLTLGVDSASTTGVDGAFQERERPPLPPSGVFDARLIGKDTPAAGQIGQGGVTDVRPGSTRFAGQKVHRVRVQPGSADSLTFTWTLPEGVTGTIEDVFGGAVFGPRSMSGRSSLTVGAGGPDALVTIDYSGGQGHVNIQSVPVAQDSLFSFVNTGVALGFSGVSDSSVVTVRRVGSGPSSAGGITETNVSSYRHVIGAEPTLSFSSAEVRMGVWALPGIGAPSAVTMYKRTQEGSGQFSPLTTSTLDGDTPGDVSDDTLSAQAGSFSEFVLASNSSENPLPVELSGFEVEATGAGRTLLSWQTASETGNAGFRVQRKRGRERQGRSAWTTVGFVEGSGTTSQPQSYRFTDDDLPYEAGALTYRLKQVDTDGSSHLSKTITVERGVQELELLSPYPNPARQQATVRYALPEPQDVEVQLYDVLGRQVRMVVSRRQEGRHERRVDLSGLPSGTYFIELKAADKTRTQRLTVVR
jgi:hypothetical protein